MSSANLIYGCTANFGPYAVIVDWVLVACVCRIGGGGGGGGELLITVTSLWMICV